MDIPRNIESDILISRYKIIDKTKTILDNILIKVSIEEKAVIICNVINEMSLDLIYNGASPKPHFISAHTEQSGVLGGFILERNIYDEASKRVITLDCMKKYFFYYSNNTIVPTTTFKSGVLYIQGLVDQDNNFFTSDLDILAVAPSSSVNCTPLPESYSMGNILKYEYDIASKINILFRQSIFAKNYNIQSKSVEIVKHGPFNRYPKTRLEDIYFPIVVYHPTNGKFFVGSKENRNDSISEFLDLLKKLQNESYNVDIPKNWFV